MNKITRDAEQQVPREKVVAIARGEMTEIFDLAPEERVAVLTDTLDDSDERFTIAEALYTASSEIAHSELVRFPPLRQSGIDPPENVVKAMLAADVILIVTSRSLTHSSATIEALKNGARIGTHTTRLASYVRAVRDARIIQERGDRLTEVLNSQVKGTMRLTTEKGTDLTFPLGERKFRNMAGYSLLRRNYPGVPHGVDNVPGGEVAIAPPEGFGSGKVHIDLLLCSWASSILPYELTVEDGRLVDCPQDPELIRRYKAKPDRDLFCEVGFGTNHAASRYGNCTMEVEKAIGTAHIAFGSNVDLGGVNQSDVHMDFIFDKVTAVLNGKTIVDRGGFCF